MDILSNLGLGFGVALSASNLLYCFVGVLLGTLVGVLPGLGPVASIAMLLPITFVLPPESALIMLAGIYYGAQYGGSTTAVLVNIPGESSSVVTAIDGYRMARLGRAGPALGIAAIGSFFAGCVSTIAIAYFAPLLTEVALRFGPAEYFSLMMFGLIAAVVLARGSVIKAIAMVVLGLLLGLVGTDLNSGTARYSFGIPELTDGLGFIAISMALFGISEVVSNLETDQDQDVTAQPIGRALPSLEDLKLSTPSILRGTALGSILGVLPGGGALLASFASYMLEKKVARPPRNFGNGDIRGVAGPESANNAGAQTSFIPMITLGVPSNPTMALMIGALMVQGITPGPTVMTERPSLFWGLIASMWIGNLMLLVLNLPLVGIWIKLLKIPYRLLFPAILAFCVIGVYSAGNNVFDVYLLAALSLLGYIFIKLDCEPAPLILGFVLGPMMEENLRRALLISRGNPSTFVTQPISLSFLIAAIVLLIILVVPSIRDKREEALQE
ncbi:tripartite tricarboxylate transporter permease [Bradyrhizobium sp. CCGUVB1N3]|uniref:tripartite tricarboxylate transporter permease n=1 Tax=Bradyrhizobium sp. CCGUVB1N3 TaxID=2949629 RepID=UPI0020B2CD4F|nr:tripartite tricarboxylate transporter permease [Bradyrhizobium sp. CCGUVB1N3]MCP3473323.1 tripartite tricarboxylate transporter permease [Bradyrhizobium sp. CCGUVB1N3]